MSSNETIVNRTVARDAGVSTDPMAAKFKRLINSVLIGIPLCGSIYSVWHFQTAELTWIEASCFLVFYLTTGVGIGIGFHRYLTHQAFVPVRWLKWLLVFSGSLAFQGPPLRWTADHRRHHRLADQAWDTHSPHAMEDRMPLARLHGLWHAHVGWMFDRTTTNYEFYVPDLLKDRDCMFFERLYPISTALSLLLPWLYGYLVSGTDHAFSCLLLGGCVRATIFQNVVWSVNSIGHSFGSQSESSRDESRNTLLLALATFGEGWHNNHHSSPRSALNQWRWYQIDPNGWLIMVLEKLHLAHRVVIRREPESLQPTESKVSAEDED